MVARVKNDELRPAAPAGPMIRAEAPAPIEVERTPVDLPIDRAERSQGAAQTYAVAVDPTSAAPRARGDVQGDGTARADAIYGRARAPKLAIKDQDGLIHRPPAIVPGASYDISSVSNATIAALRSSNKKTDQRLAQTIENAKKNYDQDIKNGARVLITTSAGNGGEPVLVMIGKGFDPKLPARVHTHYHGNDATVGDPVGSPAGTHSRMQEVQARDPQTVFVLPECENPREKVPVYYSASWGNAKSQTQTTADALKAAGITHIGKQIVSAHSKGGSALSKIINADPTGAGLKADRLELQDSLYGSQYALKDWAATANGKAAQSVLYYRASNDFGNDAELAKAFAAQGYQKIEMSRQGPINDANNPVVDQKTRARKYAPDNHYRIVGQFMDSVAGP